MKADLDALMEEQGVDALLITGGAQYNPAMYYFTGGVHLTHAELIKPRGEPPMLFFNPMERDEAAKTGLRTKNLADYNFKELRAQAEGNTTLALAMRYQLMLTELGITQGRLSLYGMVELGRGFAVFSELGRLMPGLEIVGEVDDPLMLRAMATKEAGEVARVRRMGEITVEVVGQVAEYLSRQRAKNGLLVNRQGQPITVGEVKRRIRLWLAERGVENPHGCVFAIGHDAGVPHSAGNPADPLELGKTIVFDIFPNEAGGGYHYDFTRTWCLGYAPDEVQALYEDVLAVYQQIMGELKAGEPCSLYQERTCDLFSERGHPTIRDDPKIQEGYVHSLGHGLGLHVHEAPWFRNANGASERDLLDPGVIVTIEPGLYYPSREMGCRLEDTVYVRPDGQMEILAEYPLELVIPVRGGM